MPLPALLLGVAASLAGTWLYRRGRRASLERAIEQAMGLYGIGDFDTAFYYLQNAASAADSDSSTAHFFLALGRHWRGQWSLVDEELRRIEAWPQLVMIFPSRVLTLQLRAELAALRGDRVEAARLVTLARRLATRAVVEQSHSLFVTDALLAWLDVDTPRFDTIVATLDPGRIGPQRMRLLRVLGAQLRDTPVIEVLPPNPHLTAMAAHVPRLRAFLAEHDPAAQRLADCDGRCGLHFGATQALAIREPA